MIRIFVVHLTTRIVEVIREDVVIIGNPQLGHGCSLPFEICICFGFSLRSTCSKFWRCKWSQTVKGRGDGAVFGSQFERSEIMLTKRSDMWGGFPFGANCSAFRTRRGWSGFKDNVHRFG